MGNIQIGNFIGNHVPTTDPLKINNRLMRVIRWYKHLFNIIIRSLIDQFQNHLKFEIVMENLELLALFIDDNSILMITCAIL